MLGSAGFEVMVSTAGMVKIPARWVGSVDTGSRVSVSGPLTP